MQVKVRRKRRTKAQIINEILLELEKKQREFAQEMQKQKLKLTKGAK